LWVIYGLLNRKPAIYAGNIIGLVMNFTDGERHPDACRTDLLRIFDNRPVFGGSMNRERALIRQRMKTPRTTARRCWVHG
jgi:hypothetical protein